MIALIGPQTTSSHIWAKKFEHASRWLNWRETKLMVRYKVAFGKATAAGAAGHNPPFVARVMQAAREVQCVAGSARQHGWAGARRGSGGGERAAKLAVSSSSGGGGSRSSSIRPCCTVLGQCKASVATCVPVSRANHLPRFRAPTEVLRVPQLPEHYPLSLSLSLSSLSLSPLSVSL
jgi:hypothetical protein